MRALLGTPSEAKHLNASSGLATALDPQVTKGQGSALLVAAVRGHVPLGLAILANHPRSAEVIALLLGAGADPSKGPCPALILAAGSGSVEVMDTPLTP